MGPCYYPDNERPLSSIEISSRIMYYKLHRKRLTLHHMIKEMSGVNMNADPPKNQYLNSNRDSIHVHHYIGAYYVYKN